METAKQFSKADISRLKQAIQMAELNTSGELRLHVDNRCKEDVMDRAAFIFEQLAMHKTKARNGVLFYISLEDHKFAILGDAGINEVVPNDFWDQIKETMLSMFKAGQLVEGLEAGIHMAGLQLKNHFPYQDDDQNELSDDISFGKEGL